MPVFHPPPVYPPSFPAYPYPQTLQVQQPAPIAPRAIPSNKDTAIDPSNDASLWSEHQAPGGGRSFWFNRTTRVSTYDKPLCLMTPEERSLPPCKWKEYPGEGGKVYYSDGTTSTWQMPEELRVWKLKKEELASKAKAQHSSLPAAAVNAAAAAAAAAAAVPKVVYGSPEEARAAFFALLADCGVSALMKIKEVQERVGSDPRWYALESQGERKQALAEYQVTLRLRCAVCGVCI